MVEITFKNVGQGDSIILKWDSNNISKHAIIDCNLFYEKNPVLEYIIENKVDEIEFLLMTHPHLDHFSGFYQLLKYCEKNKIKVNKFLHTSMIVKEYISSAKRSAEESNKLHELFTLIKEMRDKSLISIYQIDDFPLKLNLDDDYELEFLAPSSIESDNFIKGEKYFSDNENGKSNPNANWLSTVVKISNKKSFALLTSDIESSVLSRIIKGKNSRIDKNKKLILGQAPHHGARKNHNKTFWKLRKRHATTPIAISVGKNAYKHPSEEVISFFNNNSNYEVHRTDKNDVKSTTSIKNSSILDLISKKTAQNKNINSDKKFILK